MPDQTKKIHIDLDIDDARILACGFSAVLQFIDDPTNLMLCRLIFDSDVNQAFEGFVGLMAGHQTASSLLAAKLAGEEISPIIRANIKRFHKLIEGLLKQTDPDTYAKAVAFRDAFRG